MTVYTTSQWERGKSSLHVIISDNEGNQTSYRLPRAEARRRGVPTFNGIRRTELNLEFAKDREALTAVRELVSQ